MYNCWQSHCFGGRRRCRCSWCYIINVGCVWFDSIQMALLNVVMSTPVLFTTNDLHQVGAIIGFVDDGDREPQVPGIIEDRYSLDGKRIEVSCGSLTGHGTLHSGQHFGWDSHFQHWRVGWCAWSAVAQLCIVLAGITFPQANTSEHWLACYSMLVEPSMGLDHSTWNGWAIPRWFWQLLQLDHCF